MDGEFLAALPGTLNDRRATDIQNLFDNIQLTQTIETLVIIADFCEQLFVFVQHVLYVSQPVVDQSQL